MTNTVNTFLKYTPWYISFEKVETQLGTSQMNTEEGNVEETHKSYRQDAVKGFGTPSGDILTFWFLEWEERSTH